MDQQKEKQVQIQVNQSLKNITWKESGIPTLTQQAGTPKHTLQGSAGDYPNDFILDFDAVPTKDNGHRLGCTCKKCMKLPRTEEVKALAAMKAETQLHPFNKKRF
jgi:hypothetical protein